MKNEYLPHPVIIEHVENETPDTKTFRVRFKDRSLAESFQYKQGQFMEVSVFGKGEAPISITSSPSQKGFLEFTIRSAGQVTKAIHKLKIGDTFYTRGPYGNSFPFDEIKGRNIYFIAGGIGLAPLRSLVNLVMDNRTAFGHIEILYGAKNPLELCFKKELETWGKNPDTKVLLTVDKPTNGWRDNTGVVTQLWKETKLTPDNAVSIICGPPIMIKFVTLKLMESGFKDSDIVMTLERFMKCGLGKCGHCNIGEKFVCIDGPVFTYRDIKKFTAKEHAF